MTAALLVAAAGVTVLLFFAVDVALAAAVAVAPMISARRRAFLLPFHLFFTQLAVRPGSWAEIWDHLFECNGMDSIEMRWYEGV